MHKPIFCARIESFAEKDVTRAWQSCDLFGDGPATEIVVDGDGQPVRLQADGLHRLLAGLRGVGIGADSFAWPPPGDPDRSPYRGWQPLESVDAAVYFGRDAQIVAALDELREMRVAGREKMFVILGPSGVGKSSFLRAGLLPRLHRDDRRFLTMSVVRPQRHTLTGETGLARSIHDLRKEVGLIEPSLGEIKNAITDDGTVRVWLAEAAAAARSRFHGCAGVRGAADTGAAARPGRGVVRCRRGGRGAGVSRAAWPAVERRRFDRAGHHRGRNDSLGSV